MTTPSDRDRWSETGCATDTGASSILKWLLLINLPRGLSWVVENVTELIHYFSFSRGKVWKTLGCVRFSTGPTTPGRIRPPAPSPYASNRPSRHAVMMRDAMEDFMGRVSSPDATSASTCSGV